MISKKLLASFLSFLLLTVSMDAKESNFASPNLGDKNLSSFIAYNDTLYFLCDGGDWLYLMDRATNGTTSLAK